MPPFSNWADAATNIQAAIDAATEGDVIWVTNGVYATGGKVMAGDLTNRIVLDKALTVQSVGGSDVTIIEGCRDAASTNGPGAIRCAWLTNGAVLNGFTLRNGATRSSGTNDLLQTGGGIWCSSSNAAVLNCILSNNVAANRGGGAFQGRMSNCTFVGNLAGTGGGGGCYAATLDGCVLSNNSAWAGAGAASSTLSRCLLIGNKAERSGGGASSCSLENSTLAMNSANMGGGIAWSTLIHCTVTNNSAYNGGGAYGGTLANCILADNSATDTGGGVCNATLRSCLLTRNRGGRGGGSWQGTLNHCTVVFNSGGGIRDANLLNCIVWGNSADNYVGATLRYTCTEPLAAGEGNIAADPLLLADGAHLAANSPCQGAGSTNDVSGTDIDQQAWANPPSMGCDEWQPEPVVILAPQIMPKSSPGEAWLSVGVAGMAPFQCFWTKDGVAIEDGLHYRDAHTPDLVLDGFGPADAGFYQVTVSNAFGIATSRLAQVTVHCVNATGTGPVAPFLDWSRAATTIQEAIDVASPGAVILVTNGVYSSGGKVMAGDLMNRIALDKPVTVVSVNGPEFTIVEGQRDPAKTVGPAAVRCAWLTNGAVLGGFTLRNGATRSSGSYDPFYRLNSGGGVWGAFPNPLVANCIISNNAAAQLGGGSYSANLKNCKVFLNSAYVGGGAYGGTLNNCVMDGNSAEGARACTLNNCTVSRNKGGGVAWGVLRNCVVWLNTGPDYDFHSRLFHSCAAPLAAGTGNLSVDPQLIDNAHIALTSPCRSAGSMLYAGGTDLDGESWFNPPSMGCDEIVAAALVGPLAVGIEAVQTSLLVNSPLTLTGHITGRASRLAWEFGDGPAVTNVSYTTAHTWADAGDYRVTFTAFNADNPGGVSASLLLRVLPYNQPLLQSVGRLPNGFRFEFSGETGRSYTVEMATNLSPTVLWHTVQTISSTGGQVQVTDPATTNAAQFYRMRAW